MLSIVTGTLNRAHLLKQLIFDVLWEEEHNELVLVDGGSTDNTRDVIQDAKEWCGNQLKVLWRGKREPYPLFMNAGIRASSGHYICQLNDDVSLDVNSVWWDLIRSRTIEDCDVDMWVFPWISSSGERRCGVDANWCVLNFGLLKRSSLTTYGGYHTGYDFYYCDADIGYRWRALGARIGIMENVLVREYVADKTRTEGQADHQLYDRMKAVYERQIIPPEVPRDF